MAAKTAKRPPLSFGKKMGLIATLGVGWASLSALSDWSDTHALMINQTDSLPNWGFIVESGNFPQRGDYVIFDPGRDAIVTKYFGEKPSAFAKIAYGVPGDVVTREGNQVAVNGRTVSQLKPLTKRGDTLVEGPVGTVPEGCVYAGTPHRDGFDSRYSAIGFVCTDRLVGTASPIL